MLALADNRGDFVLWVTGHLAWLDLTTAHPTVSFAYSSKKD